MVEVVANLRTAGGDMGGQQRVAAEITKRLRAVTGIAPRGALAGARGHLWEQVALPVLARGRLLWSPSATGPIFYRRQIVTLHDVAFIDQPEFFSPNFVRFYGAIIPRLVRRAAKVVTVSNFSRERIAKSFALDPAKIEVIGNGVSDNFRQYSEADIARTRAALGLDSRYVVLQATSDRRKNLRRSLAAWQATLGRIAPDIILAVVGNMERAHVFGDIGPIAEDPRTRLLGYVDEKDFGPLIAGAAAFLFPSIYEGFGLPVVEAMACGTAVLTADATGTREVAGDAALLVDPFDMASIADGIIELVQNDDLRARLRAAGLERAKVFDWDTAARRYESIFSEFA